MANFRSYTSQQIIYKALRNLGILRTNQTNTEFSNELLPELNDMIDSWSIDRRKVWAIRADQYTLTGQLQFYLIGPGAVPATINGVSYGAFNTTRPLEIEDANLVINTVTPTVRRPIEVINADTWAKIAVQKIPAALPLVLWYDNGFSQTNSLGAGIPAGVGVISLWPGPLQTYQLELFTTQNIAQLLQFVDLVTAYALPPGYAEAISFSFSEKIVPMMAPYFKIAEPQLAEVKRLAKAARENIESLNAPDVFMDVEGMYRSGRSGAFNYATGEAGTRMR